MPVDSELPADPSGDRDAVPVRDTDRPGHSSGRPQFPPGAPQRGLQVPVEAVELLQLGHPEPVARVQGPGGVAPSAPAGRERPEGTPVDQGRPAVEQDVDRSRASPQGRQAARRSKSQHEHGSLGTSPKYTLASDAADMMKKIRSGHYEARPMEPK